MVLNAKNTVHFLLSLLRATQWDSKAAEELGILSKADQKQRMNDCNAGDYFILSSHKTFCGMVCAQCQCCCYIDCYEKNNNSFKRSNLSAKPKTKEYVS